MESFDDLVETIKTYLQEFDYGLRIDIRPAERYQLYQKFGELTTAWHTRPANESLGRVFYTTNVKNRLLNLTMGDKILSWLAIVTAKKVFSIWDRIEGQIEADLNLILSPREIMETAENCLLTKENVDSVQHLCSEYSISGAIENLVTSDVANSFHTAYDAICLVIYGSGIVNPTFKATNGWEYSIREDFVARAVNAYSAFDPNPPGSGLEDVVLQPISLDLTKQIEFWEWWLTEAIPEAWELAHPYSSDSIKTSLRIAVKKPERSTEIEF